MASKVPFHLAARAARHPYTKALLKDPNVLGVAVGHKLTGGSNTGDLGVTVFVARKRSRNSLPSSAHLPEKLVVPGGEVLTDVVEAAGPFYQHVNNSSVPPARPGTSIGEVSITAGTFGALVLNTKDGSPRILSNNHVLANNNQAPLGSPIVYPGPYDGGVAPANTIAKLSKFITIVPEAQGENFVDAALATPTDFSLIDNTPLDGVPAPSRAHPAVGLLWGGDGISQSFFSPIDTVLALLDVRFSSDEATAYPAIGMELEKTGRTTNKTQGKVTHVHATLKIGIQGIGTAVFSDQFITTLMSQGGDSGSVAVRSK